MRKNLVSLLVSCAIGMAGCGGSDGGSEPVRTATTVTVTMAPAGPLTAFGQTRTLTAVVRDASGVAIAGAPVMWSASAGGIATVVGNGSTATATAVGNGSTFVRATSGALKDSLQLTVAQAVSTVQVTPSAATIFVTGSPNTVQVVATARDANNNTVTGGTTTFATSNGSAATVNSAGLVTAQAAGSATITATVGTVTSAGVAVTVQAAPPVFPNAATVTTPNFRFSPVTVDIAAAGTVTWDMTEAPHSVIWDGAAPPGGNTAVLSNASVSRTFPTAGSFPYRCGVHGVSMSGTVVVH